MTRPLKSYPESERPAIVARRIREDAGGLGTLAAKDFEKARIKKEAARKKLVLPIEDESSKTP
jgi:hypothetical protein